MGVRVDFHPGSPGLTPARGSQQTNKIKTTHCALNDQSRKAYLKMLLKRCPLLDGCWRWQLVKLCLNFDKHFQCNFFTGINFQIPAQYFYSWQQLYCIWYGQFKLISFFRFNDILSKMFNFFHIPIKLISRLVHTWSLIKIAFQWKVYSILKSTSTTA